MDLKRFSVLARNTEPATKKFFARLKKNPPKNLDDTMHRLHEEVFEEMHCLTCANCCKTTSPVFYQKDIERVAKGLKLKPSEFIQKYLHVDEDKDYVLNSAPCPFLGPDNYCGVYHDRPTACREYPHTDRKKMYQLLDLTRRNASVCPAVFEMVEKLKEMY